MPELGLDTLKAALPEYAKDTKLNLGSVLGNGQLPEQQLWGTALACAIAAGNATVTAELAAEATDRLKPEVVRAAKAAASIMAMNNVYYRAKHLIGDPEYQSLPAGLRMTVIGRPGVDKVDFELWCLAVSAVNGCGTCLESHEKTLREAGVPRGTVHDALRIAAVVTAAATTLSAEQALG
ncbi:alkyl hydroperoxide reductase AhpD [Actinocatenispora thailandica]|uniref:Alkyl hydroperoxide reductase AhpD n=1 Tax=Actinocatenispora thailandica TaxID=227318 RepID=A0A7R7DN59_9ACTN|nr:carboxymuconolactone decarboxylase family protein [Actinocatenispora thailandica]BCJ34708.1 alkyl hydroperoxide reductase AhpD [Actinocatenispora thailandica]